MKPALRAGGGSRSVSEHRWGKTGQTAEGGRTAEKEVPVQKSQRAMRNILTGGLMSVPRGNSKRPCAAEG